MPVEDLTFINFFYGNNGAGKSSIAHAIDGDDGIEWADGKTRDDYDVLVYNQNFINDNFENYGDLAGVLIFGEEDIEAKKIAELTDQKKDKDGKRTVAGEEYRRAIALGCFPCMGGMGIFVWLPFRFEYPQATKQGFCLIESGIPTVHLLAVF